MLEEVIYGVLNKTKAKSIIKWLHSKKGPASFWSRLSNPPEEFLDDANAITKYIISLERAVISNSLTHVIAEGLGSDNFLTHFASDDNEHTVKQSESVLNNVAELFGNALALQSNKATVDDLIDFLEGKSEVLKKIPKIEAFNNASKQRFRISGSLHCVL